jgi:hypothetical protein
MPAKCVATVVFPTPPFMFITVMTTHMLTLFGCAKLILWRNAALVARRGHIQRNVPLFT